jgi:hypothetical protein
MDELKKQVAKNSDQIVEIRIQLSTFALVKTLVFGMVGMLLTTVAGGIISAGIYFIANGGN